MAEGYGSANGGEGSFSDAWTDGDYSPSKKKTPSLQQNTKPTYDLKLCFCDGTVFTNGGKTPDKLQLEPIGDIGDWDCGFLTRVQHRWAKGDAVDLQTEAIHLVERFNALQFGTSHNFVLLDKIKDPVGFREAIFSGKLLKPSAFRFLQYDQPAKIAKLIKPVQGEPYGAVFLVIATTEDGPPPGPGQRGDKRPAAAGDAKGRPTSRHQSGGDGATMRRTMALLVERMASMTPTLLISYTPNAWASASVRTSKGEGAVEAVGIKEAIALLRKTGAIMTDKKTGAPRIESKALRSLKGASDATYLLHLSRGADLFKSEINSCDSWRAHHPPMTSGGATAWLQKAVLRGNGAGAGRKGGGSGGADEPGGVEPEAGVAVPIAFDMEELAWHRLSNGDGELDWAACALLDDPAQGGEGWIHSTLIPMPQPVGGNVGGGCDGSGTGTCGAALMAGTLTALLRHQLPGLAAAPAEAGNQAPELRITGEQAAKEISALQPLVASHVLSQDDFEEAKARILKRL